MDISPDLNGRRTRNEEWPAIMLILVFCYLPAMLVSLCRVIFPLSSTSLKAGQPQPASNLVLELKRSWRQTTHTYVPVSVCLLKQPGRERISHCEGLWSYNGLSTCEGSLSSRFLCHHVLHWGQTVTQLFLALHFVHFGDVRSATTLICGGNYKWLSRRWPRFD